MQSLAAYFATQIANGPSKHLKSWLTVMKAEATNLTTTDRVTVHYFQDGSSVITSQSNEGNPSIVEEV